jgi:hypothetical protein
MVPTLFAHCHPRSCGGKEHIQRTEKKGKIEKRHTTKNIGHLADSTNFEHVNN